MRMTFQDQIKSIMQKKSPKWPDTTKWGVGCVPLYMLLLAIKDVHKIELDENLIDCLVPSTDAVTQSTSTRDLAPAPIAASDDNIPNFTETTRNDYEKSKQEYYILQQTLIAKLIKAYLFHIQSSETDKKEDTVPDVRSLGPIKNPKKERQLLINRICAQIEKMEENTYQNIRSYIRPNDVEEGRPLTSRYAVKAGRVIVATLKELTK